jgi:hypothetical protein
VQQLLVTPQPSDGQSVEPFTFWMRAQHFELTTFKHWLSERSGRYHVVGVKDARDDQVTLLLEGACGGWATMCVHGPAGCGACSNACVLSSHGRLFYVSCAVHSRRS